VAGEKPMLLMCYALEKNKKKKKNPPEIFSPEVCVYCAMQLVVFAMAVHRRAVGERCVPTRVFIMER